ncbi:Short-chain dehydrogenase ptmH [Paramyrothecium foliicola]|nr:Short-chain dehydrogenase ptmH [Paramyrothecium foliicola]
MDPVRKTALVTGTSRGGLGDYLAQELHHRGVMVFATARTASKVEHLKELGIEIVIMDVQDTESIQAAAAHIEARTGGSLDILINNSGVGYLSPLLDTDMAVARRVFDVNLFGLLEVTRSFTPMLVAAKGTVVNIGSVVGRVPVPFQGIYNASKAALEQLSKQMRVELAAFEIKVVHVVTGGIKTDFFAHAGQEELSPSSLYYPGRQVLSSWLTGVNHVEQQMTPPESFAKDVVNNALKRNPTSCQWIGRGSWYTWLTTNFLWRNATDILLQQMGWPNVRDVIKEGQASNKYAEVV